MTTQSSLEISDLTVAYGGETVIDGLSWRLGGEGSLVTAIRRIGWASLSVLTISGASASSGRSMDTRPTASRTSLAASATAGTSAPSTSTRSRTAPRRARVTSRTTPLRQWIMCGRLASA